MAKEPGGEDSDSAKRMRRIRMAIQPDGSASSFAAWLGVGANRWINVENGHPIGKDLAVKVRSRIPGMTVDYLLFGDPGHLSIELAEKLGELPPRAKANHRRS